MFGPECRSGLGEIIACSGCKMCAIFSRSPWIGEISCLRQLSPALLIIGAQSARDNFGSAKQIMMHRQVYPVIEELLHETVPRWVIDISRRSPGAGCVHSARRRSNLGFGGRD